MPAADAPPRRSPLTAAGPELCRAASPGAGTHGLQKGAGLRGEGRAVSAGPGRPPHRGSAAESGRGQPPSILRRSAAARLSPPPAGPEAFIAGGGRCAARSPHLPRLICQRHPQKGPARRRRRVNTGRGHAPNGPGRGSGRGGGFDESVLIALEQTHGSCRGAGGDSPVGTERGAAAPAMRPAAQRPGGGVRQPRPRPFVVPAVFVYAPERQVTACGHRGPPADGRHGQRDPIPEWRRT